MALLAPSLAPQQISWAVTTLRLLYANRWARYALTLALLVLVVAKVDPQRLLASLQSARAEYVALALLLTAPFLYLKALRWHLLLRAGDIQASFLESTVSLIGGMGLGLVTPARLGELVRAAYLRDPRKLRIGGLVLIDKGLDVLVLAALSIPGAWRLLGPLAGMAFVVVTFSGLFLVYSPGRVLVWLGAVSFRFPPRAKLERVWSSLESLSTRATTTYLVLTALSFVVVLVQFGLILLSWRNWSFSVVALTFPLVILTNVLPLTIGGLGIREAAAVVLLGHYGVPSAHAALAAFLMFAINTALPGIVGAVLLPPAAAARGAAGTAPSAEQL